MTVLYSVLLLVVVQTVICTRGQHEELTEISRLAGSSDEGDFLEQLPPYRKRMPLTDLTENTESAGDGQEDGMSSQIMSTDRLLNTVLMQMQRARKEGELIVGIDDTDYGSLPQYPKHRDESGYLEYEPEPNWDREERDYKKSKLPSYERLCDAWYIPVQIDDFEGGPVKYTEIICKGTEYNKEPTNQICSKLNFSCLQQNRTIQFTRRYKGSNEYIDHKIRILSGCECYWPKHRLGDMSAHKGPTYPKDY